MGTGTGGTLAGLAAGRKLMGGPEIVAVNVSPKDEGYPARTAELGTRALRAIGSDETLRPEDFRTDLGSVSYTHLDVYKRQPISTTPRPIRWSWLTSLWRCGPVSRCSTPWAPP